MSPRTPPWDAGWLAAADELERPYPEDVFTPMDDDEIAIVVDVMNEVVPNASERMHAAWARHWAEVLRKQIDER